jgi:enamine deaminase RidA (YjgF/YER057c/UK114 family)
MIAMQTDGVVLVAGQIGLDASTMTMVPPAEQVSRTINAPIFRKLSSSGFVGMKK